MNNEAEKERAEFNELGNRLFGTELPRFVTYFNDILAINLERHRTAGGTLENFLTEVVPYNDELPEIYLNICESLFSEQDIEDIKNFLQERPYFEEYEFTSSFDVVQKGMQELGHQYYDQLPIESLEIKTEENIMTDMQERARAEILETALSEATPGNLDSYSFAEDFRDIILDEMCSREESPEQFFTDLMYGGCQSGVVPALIYYDDTRKIYSDHMDDIDMFIDELEQELGWPIELDQPRFNSAVWCAFEEFSRVVSDNFQEQLTNAIDDEMWDKTLEEAIEYADLLDFPDYEFTFEEAIEGKYDIDELSQEQLERLVDNKWLQIYKDEMQQHLEMYRSQDVSPEVRQSPIVAEAEETLGKDWKQKRGDEATEQQGRGMKL